MNPSASIVEVNNNFRQNTVSRKWFSKHDCGRFSIDEDDKSGEVQKFSEQPAVVIGEQGTEVSFQVLQSVYNEITGKNEEISRRYEDAIQITMEDLKDFNSRIKQMCEPYTIQ